MRSQWANGGQPLNRNITPKNNGISTHCSLVTPHGVRHLGQHWFRQWLVACKVPSQCLSWYWVIVYLALRSMVSEILTKMQWLLFEKMHLNMPSAKLHKFISCLKLLPQWNNWLPAYRRHFQMNFLEENVSILIYIQWNKFLCVQFTMNLHCSS